ncbi:MAG: LPS export ABC transporter ATP-binding protein [Candidatus Krumholzibacteria bacterium]|jgi:lipopolysaccharide export system ATP-binding protein|nr:LPS export ABC transporter ATP-binding protein [Candidatus Krumholzibacteria bacterium]MDP6669459.1 LPS export ABC transporter ATP-binding protein [Candidatus Krumholzibacteria bacterium]MDP7021218.1 LPS export ABC transporter ATP-binding protein [Candidatus Krumholzibacteria bacterium]
MIERSEPGILRGEELVKIYGKRRVVDGVSLSLGPREVVGLLGPNGAGKTTTFYMIVGMIRPDGGRVLFGENEIQSMPMYRRARLGISYLSQESSVFRRMTVQDNLDAILEYLPLEKEEREERRERLLKELKVSHLRKSYGHQLSGGERRRVEIARALTTEPYYLLLDEPFAGIDPIAVGDVQEIISQLKEMGLGILITDHNVRETLSITDRSYVLSEGSIVCSGQTEELIENEEVREVYLGETFRL